jgi:type II secretory pathway component PulC
MPIIAIATASTAVLLSLAALVVVSTRSPKTSDPGGVVAFETSVTATDVSKLRTSGIEAVKEDGGIIGIRVADEQLRAALGLKVTDVIAGIAGRVIKKEADAFDAIGGIRYLDATTIYVDVIREGEPVVLRWKLDESLRGNRRSALDKPDDPQLGGGSTVDMLGAADPITSQIRKLDDFHYEVKRDAVLQIMADPMAVARGARIVPAMSMGKTEGLKLYAIRPTSVYAKLGFSNGDLIREINGFALDGPDKVLEIYTKLRNATSLEIALTRRGRDETLQIDIR